VTSDRLGKSTLQALRMGSKTLSLIKPQFKPRSRPASSFVLVWFEDPVKSQEICPKGLKYNGIKVGSMGPAFRSSA